MRNVTLRRNEWITNTYVCSVGFQRSVLIYKTIVSAKANVRANQNVQIITIVEKYLLWTKVKSYLEYGQKVKISDKEFNKHEIQDWVMLFQSFNT